MFHKNIPFNLLKKHFLPIIFFIFWFSYFALFWSRAIFFDKQGNIVTTHTIIWADWAEHFTFGSTMAFRSILPHMSPLLIHSPFVYPFLADLVSALLIKVGVPFFSAFIVPSFLFSLLLVVSLYFFYRQIFRHPTIAVIATTIFLLNGGTGIFTFVHQIQTSPKPLEILLHPPQKYTDLEKDGIYWQSIIDTMVIPQRSFTLGLPLGLIALSLMFSLVSEKKISSLQLKKVIPIAIIVGLLPIIHTHTFLAIGIILFFWILHQFLQLHQLSLKKFFQRYFVFCIIVALLAVPLLSIFFIGQVSSSHFIRWLPGWYAHELHLNWFLFWWRNWGVTPIVALGGWALLLQKKTQRQNAFFLFFPFWTIFILLNLFTFQPYTWDNTKLLAWASVGISGLAGYGIFRISQVKKPFFLIIGGALFLAIVATGAVDVYRILDQQQIPYTMYSKEELDLAQWVEENTPVETNWLTSDKHNHWLYNLTGRQTLMAYRGWLWSQGYNYQPIEKDVVEMFQHPSEKSLFQKYQVQYVVIGPEEKSVWQADEQQFAKIFTTMKKTPNYTIFAEMAK